MIDKLKQDLAESVEEDLGPNGEKPLTYAPLALVLNNNNRTDPAAGHVATVMRSGDGNKYKEIAVEIRNKNGELEACVIVGLDSETLEPVVSITTDGLGELDHNVRVMPMRPAETAVEVDLRNSQLSRQSFREQC